MPVVRIFLLGPLTECPQPWQAERPQRDRLHPSRFMLLPRSALLLHGILHTQVCQVMVNISSCFVEVLPIMDIIQLPCMMSNLRSRQCSCPKMRYKAEYQPSSLLCMRSLIWVPFDTAAHHLDKDGHCVLSKVIFKYITILCLTCLGHCIKLLQAGLHCAYSAGV